MSSYTAANESWAVPDIVQTTDMNSIGNNLNVNRLGGGESSLVSVSIAADLTLDLVHSFFKITGTPATVINRIEFTDTVGLRQYGNIITLIFDIDGFLNCGATANSATHAGIRAAYTPLTIYQYDVVQLILSYDTTDTEVRWYPIHVHNTGNS